MAKKRRLSAPPLGERTENAEYPDTSAPVTAAASSVMARFGELSGFRRLLAQTEAERALAHAHATERAERALAEADLFRRSVGTVVPLPPHLSEERAAPLSARPLPLPLKTQMDEQEVLREALSDAYDADALLDFDDSLSFKRQGVGVDTVKRLRRGAWVVQAQLDLHGLRTDEAREAVSLFIRGASRRGVRCVRVIHGKGLGSANREPVLKGKVRSWLMQKSEVIVFCEARERDGGAGAVVVLLQAQRPHL